MIFPPPGLIQDSVTGAAINTISDILAQRRLEYPIHDYIATNITTNITTNIIPDVPRTLNYLRFGIFDGALSHYWFILLDSLILPTPLNPTLQNISKVILDATVYTPIWCCWFLFYMSITSIPPTNPFTSISKTFLPLYLGNIGFFLPLTFLIYSQVPIEGRVLAFGTASLIYTTFLSGWNKKREEDIGTLELGGLNMEFCSVVDDDNDDVEKLGDGVCRDVIGEPARTVGLGVDGSGIGRLGVRFKWTKRKIRRINMDDIDKFLDRPLFDPTTVPDNSPLKWFANLVVDDYEKAEIVYVG
eukprot:CAMPEP_0118642514 /NCGR_PEP_ID=MMETSP0785-20121206/5873_1 /TAXON_ID=91992 /ORGANISM="Bolidomonas pacifica, Strain CCMP 1866" /LENGTH=300 /DNA_ID=CAMNT_0006534065 /DNA_START=161 /DNA_END=1059 /DNA_ORIENTATION=-